MADEKATETKHVETTENGTFTTSDLVEDVKGRDFTIAEAEIPEGYFRSARFLGSMFTIGCAFGCSVAGFTFTAPILSYISADIGPSKAQSPFSSRSLADLVFKGPHLTWVALSYLLTSSIGLIIVGRLTDIFGRRWFSIIGNAIATLGSIVCATAPSIPALIAGETFVGVGTSVQLSYACESQIEQYHDYVNHQQSSSAKLCP